MSERTTVDVPRWASDLLGEHLEEAGDLVLRLARLLDQQALLHSVYTGFEGYEPVDDDYEYVDVEDVDPRWREVYRVEEAMEDLLEGKTPVNALGTLWRRAALEEPRYRCEECGAGADLVTCSPNPEPGRRFCFDCAKLAGVA